MKYYNLWQGCPGIYSGCGLAGAFSMVKLYKGKLSRNDNDEKKNCGSNHSQKSSPRGMYIRTMFGYTTKLEGYTK
jgi:hypothetical protein